MGKDAEDQKRILLKHRKYIDFPVRLCYIVIVLSLKESEVIINAC